MTSIFEGQPLKTRPVPKKKGGSFGFQVYTVYTYKELYVYIYIPGPSKGALNGSVTGCHLPPLRV